MMRMFAPTGDALAILDSGEGSWHVNLALSGLPTQCVAVNPARTTEVYCGTFGEGLWRSDDGGRSWSQVGDGIDHQEITAAAVAPDGTVWAGTEPSAIFRSEERGRSFAALPALQQLPSAPTWSFPPRPWTSHVRSILPDPTEAERVFAGIELGGVMRSLDRGETWEDRKGGSQDDAHMLRAHPLAPGRVYEAAGGGYAESYDGGDTWQRWDDGLTYRYIWGLAILPGDPDVTVISASPGPREAHGRGPAHLYRRVGDGSWQEVGDGLPARGDTGAYVLAANPAELGALYAMTRRGEMYRSPDGGATWQRQSVAWPDGYTPGDIRAAEVTAV